MVTRFRGHADARIDDKGRLKMPATFKKSLEGHYGGRVFVTAVSNEYLQIYPIPVWEGIEEKINGLGSMNPLRRRFLTRVNRYGAEMEMDGQGRILLKPIQRKLAEIEDHVVLIGCSDHIELWPAAAMAELDDQDAFTNEDFMTLGI